MSDVVIRPAQPKDEARWRELWAGYLKFYRATVAEEVTAHTWSAILEPRSKIDALVAESEGRVIGICNYLLHDNTWSTSPSAISRTSSSTPRRAAAGRRRC
jgi:hypothetical protein